MNYKSSPVVRLVCIYLLHLMIITIGIIVIFFTIAIIIIILNAHSQLNGPIKKFFNLKLSSIVCNSAQIKYQALFFRFQTQKLHGEFHTFILFFIFTFPFVCMKTLPLRSFCKAKQNSYIKEFVEEYEIQIL